MTTHNFLSYTTVFRLTMDQNVCFSGISSETVWYKLLYPFPNTPNTPLLYYPAPFHCSGDYGNRIHHYDHQEDQYQTAERGNTNKEPSDDLFSGGLFA
ncbi:hypothetical protein [Melghirimyces profundicolus]|uniref:hypothetical protein n=1 Tax=Melghirimyces profundicolus TaxID=1242148 RepID=UPI0011B1DA83|nr:hypothetical protein [Melghirimyces profundicolus]